MSGEGEESGETRLPTSPSETVQTPASAAVPQPRQRSGYGHGHHSIEFRFLDELKRRNVGRVAILYLVVCWLILEPVHVIFHMLEVPVWANRLVILLMALGFPAVTIFAWVYEITPEGLKPTAEIPHGQSIRRQTSRRIDRAIIVVLGLALTYFVVDKFWISKHAPSVEGEKALNAPATAPLPAVISNRSIAVLPFADMSEKKDQEYFADGIAEEVLDRLAKVPGLKVVGRASSFQFKGKSADPASIGTALGVAYLLEGSVRKEVGRVRVAAQLVETRSGAQRWSDRFDSDLVDMLQVQDTIAVEIARALQITVEVATAQRSSIKSPEAHDAYLRGLQSVDRESRESSEAAVASFQQALVTNIGHDRDQLSSMAHQARDAIDKDTLTVFADRGYYKGEQILECEQARTKTLVPKPQTSGNKAAGLFDKADFRYIPAKDEYRCPAGEHAIWRYTRVVDGLTLHKYWSSACPRCPIKGQCTTGEYRRISRWEHEDVLDVMQKRLNRTPRASRIRRQTVEHPFGTLKMWMGATHFLTKTLPRVSTEMSLHVLAYNLKRVRNSNFEISQI